MCCLLPQETLMPTMGPKESPAGPHHQVPRGSFGHLGRPCCRQGSRGVLGRVTKGQGYYCMLSDSDSVVIPARGPFFSPGREESPENVLRQHRPAQCSHVPCPHPSPVFCSFIPQPRTTQSGPETLPPGDSFLGADPPDSEHWEETWTQVQETQDQSPALP